MASKCDVTRNQQNRAFNANELAYSYDVKTALNSFLGSPDDFLPFLDSKDRRLKDIAVARHTSLYNRLHEMLIKNGEDSMYLVNPFEKIRSLDGYMGWFLGLPPDQKILFASPRRAISVIKELNRILDMAEKEKSLNKFEKGFTPIVIFAWKHDKFGMLSKYTELAQSLTENYRSSASPYIERSSRVTIEYYDYIDDVINTLTNATDEVRITEKMTAGGFPVNTQILDDDGNLIKKQFIGTVTAKDGSTKHMVVDDEGNYSLVNESEISFSAIVTGLKRHYTAIADDIMNGQTRKVKWTNEVLDKDKNTLLTILKTSVIRKREKENNVRIYSKTHAGIRYNYVLIKDKEGSVGEEEYRGYLISHHIEGEVEPGTKKNFFYYAANQPDTGDRNDNVADFIKWKHSNLVTKKIKRHDPTKIPAFTDGFWTSNSYSYTGEILNKKGIPIKKSSEGGFTSFDYMPNQPFEGFVTNKEGLGTKLISNGIWSYIAEKRSNYRESKQSFITLATHERTIYDKAIKRFLNAMITRFPEKEERDQKVQEIIDFIGANSNVAYDPDTGSITTTPNSYFSAI